MKTLIRNARILNPASGHDEIGDLLIDGEVVAQVGKSLNASNAIVIDADGLWLMPGLVDIHVHLREPGHEGKETIASGTRAAAAGGITSVVCMPNTTPPIDNRTGIEFILDRSERAGYVRVYPCGTVTKGLEGKEISPIGEMVEAGAVAICDEERGIMDSIVMRRALEYSTIFGIPLITHCEDHNLTENGSVNEGFMSMTLGLTGSPSEAEAILVARDCLLARKTGAHVHIAHVSCAESIDLIRFYKQKGASITAEVTPHHLLLTEEATDHFNTLAKVNPPLRTKEDQDALYEGLRDGTIDCIASDHSPHGSSDKIREFPEASFGVIGLETLLPLLLGPIQERLGMDTLQVLSLVTQNPARIMRLPGGDIGLGHHADVILWNPKPAYRLDVQQLRSNSHNTPFQNWEMKGCVEHTFICGHQIYNRERNEFRVIKGRVPMQV